MTLESRPSPLALCFLLVCSSFIPAPLVAQAASNAVESPAAVASGANGAAQLQVRAPLVLEDLVVLDGDGQPVHGLKATDFVVTEDGKPVTVRDFAEAAAPAPATAPPKRPRMGLNTFTNLPRVEPGAPLNILLLDSLNTPAEDQYRVRQQMLSYLKEIAPDTRIAIFGLATHLYLLQGFSSDPAVLRSALEKKSGTELSPLLDNPISGGSELSMTDMMDSSDLLPAGVLANLQQFEAEQQTSEARQRMIYTVEAMNELARYLAALPGRKNLIWFSGSFPLNILPDTSIAFPQSMPSGSQGPILADPFAAAADFRDDVRQTAELLATSRVAVYPIDARGVMPNPAFSVSQNLPGTSRNGHFAPGSIIAANHKFYEQTNAEHSTMDLIAAETGGKAFYNTNGLKQALKEAIDFGQDYYTLAYTPTNPKWDGSYRKIVITTTLPHLHLYFRPGYFADDPNAPASARKNAFPDAMQTAMLPGGPDATQVIFGARLIPAEKPSDQLSPDAHADAKQMKPPYMRYAVQLLVDVRTVEMSIDDKDVRHGSAMLAAVVYARDGTPVNSTARQVRIDLAPDQYEETLKKATLTTLNIDVPVKGEFFVRIGVQDMTGNRVGALDVPVSALHSYDELLGAARKAGK